MMKSLEMQIGTFRCLLTANLHQAISDDINRVQTCSEWMLLLLFCGVRCQTCYVGEKPTNISTHRNAAASREFLFVPEFSNFRDKTLVYSEKGFEDPRLGLARSVKMNALICENICFSFASLHELRCHGRSGNFCWSIDWTIYRISAVNPPRRLTILGLAKGELLSILRAVPRFSLVHLTWNKKKRQKKGKEILRDHLITHAFFHFTLNGVRKNRVCS